MLSLFAFICKDCYEYLCIEVRVDESWRRPERVVNRWVASFGRGARVPHRCPSSTIFLRWEFHQYKIRSTNFTYIFKLLGVPPVKNTVNELTNVLKLLGVPPVIDTAIFIVGG